MGHHGLSYQLSTDRISDLNGISAGGFVTVNVPAALEPSGTSRADGKRRNEMTLIPRRIGRTLVWDTTCVDKHVPFHLK